MQISDLMKDINSSITKAAEEETEVKKELISGLGTSDTPNIETIKDAISNIRALFEKESIPTATIEIGLKQVMVLLKSYEDLALELEPENIADIVTSYMQLADEEVRTIFDKAAKKKTKPKEDATTKRILKAAKEQSTPVDFGADDLIL